MFFQSGQATLLNLLSQRRIVGSGYLLEVFFRGFVSEILVQIGDAITQCTVEILMQVFIVGRLTVDHLGLLLGFCHCFILMLCDALFLLVSRDPSGTIPGRQVKKLRVGIGRL